MSKHHEAGTNELFNARSPRGSDALWGPRPMPWDIRMGQHFDSVRDVLAALMRHAHRFRYRFAVARLDEKRVEVACSTFNRALIDTKDSARCSFHLACARSGENCVVEEWQYRHTCTAAFRVSASTSHDALTDALIPRVLGGLDEAETWPRPKSHDDGLDTSLRMHMGAFPRLHSHDESLNACLELYAEAEAAAQVPPPNALTLEDVLSFDRPRTPPPQEDPYISFTAQRQFGSSASGHARGEHGSLGDLREYAKSRTKDNNAGSESSDGIFSSGDIRNVDRRVPSRNSVDDFPRFLTKSKQTVSNTNAQRTTFFDADDAHGHSFLSDELDGLFASDEDVCGNPGREYRNGQANESRKDESHQLSGGPSVTRSTLDSRSKHRRCRSAE